MRRGLLTMLTASVLATAASAQPGQVGTEPSPEPGSEATQGSGTTGDVTQGTSGGESGDDTTVEPLSVDMPYPEQDDSLLGLPGSLSIAAPNALRCDIIEHENARSRCEATDPRASESSESE